MRMSELPADYERRLMNGAMVVCGPAWEPTLKGLADAGILQGATSVVSDRAATLALPDTLMLHAILVYAHYVPGAGPKGPTAAELDLWRAKVIGELKPAAAGEPFPAVELNADPGAPEVILQLTWAPSGGSWNGVRSTQVKRVAEQLDARMAALNGGRPAAAPQGGSPKALWILLLLAGLGLAAWLASR